ncbi:liprin-beta-2-like isoform X4 [Argiope bruennichi]|uniref:liprin-beta-2-like isoform X4 n=1 Tax=Argiope bruennichi TaxID=94029 RepID=UPI002495567B|nr:liprin-beta-2-like isoform X4 [Argiope bruennichi]
MPATSTEKRKNNGKPSLDGKRIFLVMKSQSSMHASENGLKSPTGAVLSQDRQDGEDTEDDDDEDRSEQATVAVADLCSASHEFEWLSPNSHEPLYSHNEKPGEKGVYSDPPQGTSTDDQGLPSCQVSPARSVHSRHNKHPPHVWPRRPDIMDHIRMSPNPYSELHGCRRHLSPMRSSWCCPSPPPHPVCVHHGGSMLSGMEIVPYNYDYYGNEMPYLSYHNCSCLPPTGLSHAVHHHESHSWCRNTSPHHEIIRRESSSPCAMHRSCQGLGRRSRSSSSRKRDCSPSALSPRYSPVPQDPASNVRHSSQEQWQIPVTTEEANNLQKLHNLESDKKNLILHASVLADQVEAQGEKINELEKLLDQKKEELLRLEQSLHQEVLARSSAENSKLELMTELSNLRLRLTTVERDRKESDEKCRKLENELISLQTRLIDHETEHSILKGKFSHNGSYILNANEGSEMEKLKSVLDSVSVSNDEKDQKIEDLRSSLTKYKKLQDIVMSNHGKIADTKPQKPSALDTDSVLSSINSDIVKRSLIDASTMKKTQTLPSAENISPTSYQFNQTVHSHTSPKVSPNSATAVSPFQKSNSVENISHPSVTLIPNNQYGTMPRQTSSQVLQQLQGQFRDRMADSNSMNSSVEKTNVQKYDSSKEYSKVNRSAIGSGGKSSGVSFAAEECVTIPSTEKENNDFVASLTPQPYLIKAEKDRKGFLKFFAKFKKSGSQNIDRVDGDFKRGGMRATAGPRLGWSRDILQDPDIPFLRWNTDTIVEWLQRLGLNMYTSECKRWMCNGEILGKATTSDLEKELGIKNPLHRKKLILAIKSLNGGLPNLPASINTLDYNWVVRWLDDVGLPQYKDSFADARVDGRVLHCITVDDLLFLKVTSQLHHISIRRGIQLLREKAFDPHCLIRRSLPDESKIYTPELVALWSNHRVMEWLRTVDLSEYAPNLRGSGVHGALIVYEPKFNTNLFATLLNIPPTKTLLRRHLATHFKHIVGEELTQIKREKETETPLSPSVKVKAVRKTQFALKKKRNKNEIENEDYICPMDIPVVLSAADSPKFSEVEKLVVRRNSDPSPQEQRHIDLKEDTVERIGSVSKEISSLTTILQDENLNGAPTTVV